MTEEMGVMRDGIEGGIYDVVFKSNEMRKALEQGSSGTWLLDVTEVNATSLYKCYIRCHGALLQILVLDQVLSAGRT